ncbi:hypothetical protein HPHPH42_1744 [Helicobacter pylori Hp H-42]|uniref:Uncharacterized protein n=1 Tax=Helicobacter pylori Hp H-42 TaxID=992047 RepID=A0AB33XEU9_HELPX|nr:hypothetical protein HPHPH42_1744 [Helicobacter pylori Hp H-42]
MSAWSQLIAIRLKQSQFLKIFMFHSLFDWLEYYNNIFNSLFLRIFFIL